MEVQWTCSERAMEVQWKCCIVEMFWKCCGSAVDVQSGRAVEVLGKCRGSAVDVEVEVLWKSSQRSARASVAGPLGSKIPPLYLYYDH